MIKTDGLTTSALFSLKFADKGPSYWGNDRLFLNNTIHKRRSGAQ